MSIFHKKDIELDSQHPVLAHLYGKYIDNCMEGRIFIYRVLDNRFLLKSIILRSVNTNMLIFAPPIIDAGYARIEILYTLLKMFTYNIYFINIYLSVKNLVQH